MGHADFSTTEIYLSYKPRADAARRLAEAFAAEPSPPASADTSRVALPRRRRGAARQRRASRRVSETATSGRPV